MSFLLDPPMLVGAGAAIERLAPDERTKRIAQTATVAVFVGTSVGLYLEAPWTRWLWKLCGARSGRDWMLNSGVTRFEYERPSPAVHVAAAAMFALYPSWLRFGRRLARR